MINLKFLIASVLAVVILTAPVPDNYTGSGSVTLLPNILDLGYSLDQKLLVVLT